MPPADPSDEELLARHQGGDPAAFEALVDRYRLELFHFLIRFTGERVAAEDLFQESFLQVHLSAGTFDPERRFKPWLFTIAANKARDFLRRNQRRQAAPLSAPIRSGGGDERTFVDLMQADLPMPHEQLQRQEVQELVRQVVESLPDHLREILLLSYFHAFAYKEIADMLGIPLGTVKSRLHAAVAAFAQNWKALYEAGRE